MSARILVVDDVDVNVKLLEAKLSSEYFNVLSASDGQGALTVAQVNEATRRYLDPAKLTVVIAGDGKKGAQ